MSWEWNSDSLRRDPFALEGKDGKFFYHKKPCPSDEGRTRELTREEMINHLEGLANADLRRYTWDDPAKVVSRKARAILTHLNAV